MSSSVNRLEFKPGVWHGLVEDLRRRGGGRRESGAFLLGNRSDGARVVERWVAYDELDPGALNFDYVRLSSEAFSALWSVCSELGLEVVADVHTHPKGPRQSPSDRANPMISIAGHVALIVPRFAQGDVSPSDVSFNVFQADGQWQSSFGQNAAASIKLL